MADEKDVDQSLRELREAAKATLKRVERMNDAYPATREFLDKKGVSSVGDLDKEGFAELKEHLQNTLKRILAQRKTPSQA